MENRIKQRIFLFTLKKLVKIKLSIDCTLMLHHIFQDNSQWN